MAGSRISMTAICETRTALSENSHLLSITDYAFAQPRCMRCFGRPTATWSGSLVLAGREGGV